MFDLPQFLPRSPERNLPQSFPGERTRRVQELRRSSASSRHVPAPRKGTRTQAVRRALKDQEAR